VSAPRIACIPAQAAPVVAVIRRGPAAWTQIGRWDVEHDTYEPGAWIRARVYEDRCDLSPDGRWFAYFTLRGSIRPDWPAGGTYIAISRLPWVKALAAWRTCGTWTRGVQFVTDRRVWDLDEPDVGDVSPCRRQYGMKVSAPLAYPVEHRRGWRETPESPPREARGHWDEQIDRLVMAKPRPIDGAPELRRTIDGYLLRAGTEERLLPDVQWADWDPRGRLLVATKRGALEIRTGSTFATVAWTRNLAADTPDPKPPPADASRW